MRETSSQWYSYAKQTFSSVFKLKYSRAYFIAFIITFITGIISYLVKLYSAAFTLIYAGAAFSLYSVYTAKLRENLSKYELAIMLSANIFAIVLSFIIDIVWRVSDITTMFLPGLIVWTVNVPLLGKLVYKIYSRGIEKARFLNK